MSTVHLTRDEVIERSHALSSFPSIVTEILETLDDPDANLHVLVRCISLDPLVTARVLSVANTAAVRGRRELEVSDIYTATSLIGMRRVREITLISSLGAFVGATAQDRVPSTFWQHSVAVGVCCQELALHASTSVSTDIALIAGLLHDIGQLWFCHYNAELHRTCVHEALSRAIDIEVVEREYLGVGHSVVGAWLAEHWALPTSICAAIRGHHAPDAALDIPLVPVVHVAEVLSHALDITGGNENRVTGVSGTACAHLGLTWTPDIRPLFGRMVARSRHTNQFFCHPPNATHHAPHPYR